MTRTGTLRFLPALLILATCGGAAQAQSETQASQFATAEEPDADNLAAAIRLVDLILPPRQRSDMINSMVGAMLKNITDGILADPSLQSTLNEHPEMRTVFANFVERQRVKSLTQMEESLPGLVDAMGRAYARTFTADQLADMHDFFATPTGQVYVTKSVSLMSDPDVAAWQRGSMQDSMADLPGEIERLMTELRAAGSESRSGGTE